MLELTTAVRDDLVAHALRGLPHEACGLFAGVFGSETATRFYPMRNAAESSEIYQLDPAEMLEVERAADAEGLAVLGVMHSHTHTTAYPSPTDVRDASTFDPFGAFHYIIVSLRHADPAVRSYRIVDGVITEEAVAVVDHGSTLDGAGR